MALGFARSSGLARVFSGSPRSLVHLLTLGGIASALLEPVAAAASGPPEPPASMTKTSIVALVVALVLVIMGISFEKAQHYLIHHTGEHMQRVLISLFEELTLLGVFLCVSIFAEFVAMARLTLLLMTLSCDMQVSLASSCSLWGSCLLSMTSRWLFLETRTRAPWLALFTKCTW